MHYYAMILEYINQVFPRPFTHEGDLSPPVQGDKALMGDS